MSTEETIQKDFECRYKASECPLLNDPHYAPLRNLCPRQEKGCVFAEHLGSRHTIEERVCLSSH